MRVIPYTATGHHAMGGSSFNLMAFPSSKLGTLVWQETVTSTELIDDDMTVREYGLGYAELVKSSYDRQHTMDLIKQAITGLR